MGSYLLDFAGRPSTFYLKFEAKVPQTKTNQIRSYNKKPSTIYKKITLWEKFVYNNLNLTIFFPSHFAVLRNVERRKRSYILFHITFSNNLLILIHTCCLRTRWTKMDWYFVFELFEKSIKNFWIFIDFWKKIVWFPPVRKKKLNGFLQSKKNWMISPSQKKKKIEWFPPVRKKKY